MGNKSKLMTAEEARCMVVTMPSDEEVNKINNKIQEACMQGDCYAYIDGSVTKFAKKLLEDNGFTVKHKGQYNESYTVIKW